ncbi:DUF3231 family protein [Priestia endophytica]|uniref:DUF3231 family protein n=1 Tax=Priestia endophytica DSM 13796 TaxID=1121089 RepID=A0A1I6C344_9BACI|nr:DUF3231 family protein [Priestia endophytica]KYG32938.1 hypothetical protein AZF06_22635 [Priestia endophytica]SFQ87564.1 Protein of unknown function [Priestia endophytica DSM 13796]
MDTIKPTKIGKTFNDRLTSAELGKLWATYMGNSMSTCILSYFLQHVEDSEIKKLVENAAFLSEEFQSMIKEIFIKEHIPVPHGFTKEDVNLKAPKLFEDEFYVHYLKYAAKAGMSIYNVAVPLMYREDVRDFYLYCMDATMKLMEQINSILMDKRLIIKPPIIPIPEGVKIARSDYLKGLIEKARPLHALEITHLYDNIESNVTSKALIMAFRQVAKMEKVREVFKKGEDLTTRAVERYMTKLHEDHLPAPSFLDHLVTTSTVSPFSDKLMLFHKVDMFSMKIRAFGNSVAVNGRHDLALLYGKSLTNIFKFVDDASQLMMKNGWMEVPPEAVDRENLALKGKPNQ